MKVGMPQIRKPSARSRGETHPKMIDRIQFNLGVAFAILSVACLFMAILLPFAIGITAYESFNLMLLPLMFMGACGYILNRRWLILMIATAATVAVLFLFPWATVETVLILFGIEGIAVAADILQRAMFFRIIGSVQYVNAKPKRNFFDLLALYVFNIPKGLDARRIVMDDGIRRIGIPWKEIRNRVILALFFCLFIWMYMFANEDYSHFTFGSVDAVFIATGYVAIVVLAFSLLETLNVRIETDHGGFRIYSGLMGTMWRIVLPLSLATILLAIVLFQDAYVLLNIAMSAAAMLGMVVVASELYYLHLENATVNDIRSARAELSPINLCAGIDGDVPSLADAPPGTPCRDADSCFDPIPDRKN